ncbi:NYN domain-containing protein [Candidatus Parcubacteria bacterium]|nr:NYN domain-containing protein [Candidatus Parcubacteria bacterium]
MSKNGSEKILKSIAEMKAGVFIDDSNLYHACKKNGWRVDLLKLKKLLEGLCNLQFINYYVGIPEKNDSAYKGTEKFLNKIKKSITIKAKKLKYIPARKSIIKKADVDVEITLDVVRNVDDLELIIISGDSDFHELKNYTIKDKGKNIIFIAFRKNMAWELRNCWHLFIDDYQDNLKCA